MSLIALTGGIASGKSTIAQRLAAHGAVVVDADQIVRQVQRPGSPVLAEIAEHFGSEMIEPAGELNRRLLAERVFGKPDALQRLNEIVHPAVRAESTRQFQDAWARDPGAVVVYDVPLLVEARLDDPWELIVVAHAPADLRAQRLITIRGLSAEEAQTRIAAQVSDDARLALADVVIDTSGTLEHTHRQVDELWQRITPAAPNV